jgi:hypothetical protein
MIMEVYKEKNDKYTEDILRERFYEYKNSQLTVSKIAKTTGLPIRNQNPPEDITENIAKIIIRNYEKDKTCKWAKSIGLTGDLFSEKYDINYPIEIKSFTSNGPCSFGPKKKFGIIYFLDMREYLYDKIILWKVNVNSDSTEWNNLSMNKKQTFEEQCKEKRRPHIGWDKIYSQLSNFVEKVYEGTFEEIFIQ